MSIRFNQRRRGLLAGSLIAAAGASIAALLPRVAAAQAAPPASPQPPRFEGFGDAKVDELFWAKVRSHFSLDPQLSFLNNGTLGPAPDVVVNTREYYNHLLATDPTDNFRPRELREVRAQLAALINAQPEEVSITHSTTEGMNIFAHGLDWREGDEVVLSDQEHFGAVEPYRTLAARFGVKLVTVKLPVPAESVEQVVAAYFQAFTARTRVLVVSHVSYVTGLVAPLRELAELSHAHGALISVDGAQSFGVLPLDVVATGVDHFAGAGQKWLLAGTGTGVNYTRKSVQPKVWPLYGFDDPGWKVSPRYERGGQLGIPAALGIGAAVQFHRAIGSQNIEARARELAGRLRDGVATIPGAKLISSSDARLAANINVVQIPNLSAPATAKLLAQREKIVLRGLAQGPFVGLRVSTHYYNTPQQIDRLLGVLAAWSKTPPEFPPEENGRSHAALHGEPLPHDAELYFG